MYNSYDEFHPQGTNVIKHIAIIPDGGRRWAKSNGYTYYMAYKRMCMNLYEYCKNIYSRGVDVISLYFSSTQNFRRVSEEIDAFCKAETEFLNEYAKEISKQYKVNIIIVGKREGLPDYMMAAIKHMPPIQTINRRKLYICINYNPHYEIEKAVIKAKEKDDLYINYLDVKEPVDIMIRTGGANVTSNFLMPQLGFARLFFLDKLFNDITMCEIDSVLNDYIKYELKYGN